MRGAQSVTQTRKRKELSGKNLFSINVEILALRALAHVVVTIVASCLFRGCEIVDGYRTVCMTMYYTSDKVAPVRGVKLAH
mmetsp:Transcript_17748/g.26447  ORF Transcript_17748/g.26447 Transcript_17748/m.26447 type:complete len:81 (-) Transcript_17748:66-308(-)